MSADTVHLLASDLRALCRLYVGRKTGRKSTPLLAQATCSECLVLHDEAVERQAKTERRWWMKVETPRLFWKKRPNKKDMVSGALVNYRSLELKRKHSRPSLDIKPQPQVGSTT